MPDDFLAKHSVSPENEADYMAYAEEVKAVAQKDFEEREAE